MFLEVKEFALYLYVESRYLERSRRIKGKGFSQVDYFGTKET